MKPTGEGATNFLARENLFDLVVGVVGDAEEIEIVSLGQPRGANFDRDSVAV